MYTKIITWKLLKKPIKKTDPSKANKAETGQEHGSMKILKKE